MFFGTKSYVSIRRNIKSRTLVQSIKLLYFIMAGAMLL